VPGGSSGMNTASSMRGAKSQSLKTAANWNGDLGARQFWYNSKSVTIYDPATPFYASEASNTGSIWGTTT
jgi:hypothetical protein